MIHAGDLLVWGWGGVGDWVGVSGWGGIKFTKETPLNSTCKTSAGMNFIKEIPSKFFQKKNQP